MRDVAGHGQHQIVMFGRHNLDAGAERLPELRQPLHGGLVGILGRCENAPAVDEQFGEAGVGTGMFGAGDRVPGNEMHAGGNVRRHFTHDVRFDRADVGDNRSRFEMRADLARYGAADADRDGNDHQIGAFGCGRVGVYHRVGEAELTDAPPRRFGSRGRDNRFDDAERPRRPRDRRADEADADQRQPIEQRCGLGHSITPLLPGNL